MFSRTSTEPRPPSNANTPSRRPRATSIGGATTPKSTTTASPFRTPISKSNIGKQKTVIRRGSTAAVSGSSSSPVLKRSHSSTVNKKGTSQDYSVSHAAHSKRSSPDPTMDIAKKYFSTSSSESPSKGRKSGSKKSHSGARTPRSSAASQGVLSDTVQPSTGSSPVVHIRIRPLLSYLGESNDQRHVWFLDHQNLVVQLVKAGGRPNGLSHLHSRTESDISSVPVHSETASKGSVTPPQIGLGQRIGPGAGSGGVSPRKQQADRDRDRNTTLNNSVMGDLPPAEAGEEQHFTFKFVHDEDASQEEVFEESVLPFADEALLAQNIAILCYGPTGSGKTFSMMGDLRSAHHTNSLTPITKIKSSETNPLQEDFDDSLDNSLELPEPKMLHARTESTQVEITKYDAEQMIVSSMGILPRLVTVLLEHRGVKTPVKSNSSITLHDVTFYGVELYMDELFDLLDRNKRRITNVGDTGGLANLCEKLEQAKEETASPRQRNSKGSSGGGIHIDSMSDLHRAYRLARRNRVTSSHMKNDTSSRSHAIFVLQLGFDFVKNEGSDAETVTRVQSYVAMADLAGCERVKDTRVEGTALREAQYINKSLSALSSVVLSLFKRSSHVPYRDSKLTRLLRSCLEGGRVLTLVHISPCSPSNTINTLKFADQVRHAKVQTHAFGEGVSKKELQELYEGLTDPSLMALEDAVQRSTLQYAQVCAEVRLLQLSQWANSSDGWTAATTQPSSHANTSELSKSCANSEASQSFTESVAWSERSAVQKRGMLVKSLVQQHTAQFWEQEEDNHAAIRRLERERDRSIEASEKKLQQTIRELEAAVEVLEFKNAQLAEENTAPILTDPFEVELARLAKETNEEIQTIIHENQQAQTLSNVLRQRISIQGEVEDAIQAEIDELERRKDSRALLGGSNTVITDFNSTFSALDLADAENDNEIRDIFHEQVLLAQDMSRLRLETACAQHGGKMWEMLWAHSMRLEMLLSLQYEVSLMTDILLEKDALELLLADVPPPITAHNTSREGSTTRPRGSSVVVYNGGAEAEEALRESVKDFLDEKRLEGIVVSRPDSPFNSDADDDDLNKSKASKQEKEVRRRLTSYHKRGTATTKELPNPLQSFNWASSDDLRQSYNLLNLLSDPNSPTSSATKELYTILSNTIPLSLVGSYGNEEELQRVAVRKLLEEGILCEVCCAASSFEPLTEYHLEYSGKKTETGNENEENNAEEANVASSNHTEIPLATRWGRLRLTRSVRNPQQYILEFVYSPGGIPLSRKMQAAMAGEREQRDELVDFVDNLPSSLNVRRGVTPPAHSPTALNPPTAPTLREYRLFSIPLSEAELQLNVHVLESGVTRYTPVSTSGSPSSRRLESGGQVVLEVLGVPLPSGEPMSNAILNQRVKSSAAGSPNRSKGEDGEGRVPVLSKKLTSGGELLFPTNCTLASRGACAVVVRFPSPTFTNLTRIESMEVIVAALSGLLPPTFAAAVTHTTPPSAAPLLHNCIQTVVYSHVPYLFLNPTAPSPPPSSQRSFTRELSARPKRESPGVSHNNNSNHPPPHHGDTYAAMMSVEARNKLEPSPSMSSVNAGQDPPAPPSRPTSGAALEIKFYLPVWSKTEDSHGANAEDTAPTPVKEETNEEFSVMSRENVGLNVDAYTPLIIPTTSGVDFGSGNTNTNTNGTTTAHRSSVRDRLLAQQRERKSQFSNSSRAGNTAKSGAPTTTPSSSTPPLPVKSKSVLGVAAPIFEEDVRSTAQLLHQLRAVTIHSSEDHNRDRLSRWSAHVGQRLHELQQYRRGVRSLVKQQIFEAEDLSEMLGVQDVLSGRGMDVQDIEREARLVMDLDLPDRHALVLSPIPPSRAPSASRDSSSPLVRSDVTVYEARELCGGRVPWTLWQWAYRWPTVASLYRREAEAWDQTETALVPGVSPSSGWQSPANTVPLVKEFSSSSDELFTLDQNPWGKRASASATPRTVWLPELHFAAVPPFLENFFNKGEAGGET